MRCVCDQCAAADSAGTGKCLKDFWIFDHFCESQLQDLQTIGIRREIPAGQLIFNQGGKADELFLIRSGSIKLSKVSEDGTEVTLDFRRYGDVLGEDIFSGVEAYPVSAMAIDDTVTCGFNLSDFQSLVRKKPDIGLSVIKSMSNKISALSNRIGSIAEVNLEDRLYSVLSSISKEHGCRIGDEYTFPFKLTHEELAFLVGAHRVSITKAMQALISKGRICCTNKIITLKNC
ncbi:Crp/Fnr family transcriptional regulator [Maridesulfovibrio salexigens]|uniref:Transcriptional regulator, Crp/Fnr family n=1 Tax=Maridesulfovibrio salexigens (strain ATCC 14822 / DSM 2638 / NCIMB 8403 / VKM B-1763) TaxID=526222 RepID=C6BU70_MARSD|nr:Crp/Fnr family transcriptional regulator [Maridesulfovibrio salexigens]ACS81779.1 transcriptional regulator, Crp/Fnr family [Maridesulfovibrio salexigens DSM 2638]